MSPIKVLANIRGQASILIAIIFQVLFIFFAMVINVGLLVNDKINLQNSVDIAAYYGAMKQAEVLNVIGHVNYQIHSTYKLFNFRLWSLGNSGRSGWYDGNQDLGDHQASWFSGNNAPIVCMAHKVWYDWSEAARRTENLCRQPNQYVPPITPITLTGFQPAFAGFLSVFASQSATNSSLFQADFKDGGKADYSMALRILASYKISAGKKRLAIQSLQKLLTGVGQGSPQAPCQVSANDFCDISGSSVRQTIESIINKNLTAANLKGLGDIEFVNPLFQRPFLVPIEVRTFVKYEDLTSMAGEGSGIPQDVNVPPRGGASSIPAGLAELFYGPDYEGTFPPPSAAGFAGENDPLHNFNSLVGFEKDPWMLAYVKVSATSSPKMLFSPFTSGDRGGVTLRAEAFAMPFGSHVGPWYADGWSPNAASSNSNTKVDPLLPPRYPEAVSDSEAVPNFSRYPGDRLGMKSALAENVAIPLWAASPPHFADDNYNYLDTDPANVTQSEIVPDNRQGDNSPVHQAEIAAIAPNLFEAVYFPIDSNFDVNYRQNTFGGGNLFGNICGGRCEDLGSGTGGTSVSNPEVVSVTNHVAQAIRVFSGEWWLIHNPNELNASWTQEATDDYGSRGPTKVALAKKDGGRTGYSVKIVSKEFLNSSLPFGGSAGSGSLKNSPSVVTGD